MVATRAEAAQYLKDAAGLKLVVLGADGQQIAAMFVQGSVGMTRRNPPSSRWPRTAA